MAKTRKKREKKKKQPKPPLLERVKKRGAEFTALGGTLVREPKSFPRELLQFLRKSIRTVWDARGGGLYALGFVITFVWLELKMLVLDIIESESVSAFFGEQIFEMLFRFVGESIQNTVSAFIWPVSVIEISPPWSVAGLVIAFMIFDKFLKAPVERLLFGSDCAQPDKSGA